MLLPDVIDNLIGGTVGSAIHDAFARGWEAAAPADEYPIAQRSEILDAVTCPVCRAIDMRIMERSDPRYRRWQRGVHINCRGIWVHLHRDEVDNEGRPTQPNWIDPDPELVAKHAHFIAQPEKYSALNVPVRPTGRDFIAYRPLLPEGGLAPHVTLRWRDALPDWALRDTLREMAAGLGDRLAALPIAGDRELAVQMLGHASSRRLLADPGAMYEAHGGDWSDTAGMLTEDEFRSLPARAFEASGTSFGTHTNEDGSVEWFLYNAELPLPANRTLPDVAVLYAPDQADITTIARLPAEMGLSRPGPFPGSAEATAWARRTYGGRSWEFGGVDVELVPDVLEQWDVLRSQLPSVAADIGGISSALRMLRKQTGYAWADQLRGQILLAREDWFDAANLRAILERDVASGWLTVGSGTARGVISHEFGHFVVWKLQRSGMTISELKAFALDHGFHGLSGLAKDSYHQAMAEAFASLMHHPSVEWGPPIRALDQLLREKGLL